MAMTMRQLSAEAEKNPLKGHLRPFQTVGKITHYAVLCRNVRILLSSLYQVMLMTLTLQVEELTDLQVRFLQYFFEYLTELSP